jgi:hypothetical protein
MKVTSGKAVDIDHGLGESLRVLLRNVVAEAGQDSVLVFTGELLAP